MESPTAQPYPSHSTDSTVGNNVNKTFVFINQDCSDGFRHTGLEVCRSFDQVVLFALTVSGGGRLKNKVHMKKLEPRRWKGKALHLSVSSIRVLKLRRM